MNDDARPRVAVRSLGGTVAMTSQSDDGAVPTMSAADLVTAVPGLESRAVIDAGTLSATPGASLRLPDLVSCLAQLEAACTEGASGVVVTTGTDTLEEIAFLFDLLWGRPEPLVITGAMRTADSASSDGPANLLAAVTVAASAAARGHGCLAVINDQVHSATAVRKTHTTSVAAFASVGCAPVGEIHEGTALLRAARWRPEPIRVPADVSKMPRVALIRLALDDDGDLLKHAAESHDGIVIEAFGAGHVPAWWVEDIKQAARRIPVVVVSRTGDGRLLRRSYGFSGSERDLVAADTILVDGLDGVKARILLTMAILAASDRADVARLVAAHSPLLGTGYNEGA